MAAAKRRARRVRPYDTVGSGGSAAAGAAEQQSAVRGAVDRTAVTCTFVGKKVYFVGNLGFTVLVCIDFC